MRVLILVLAVALTACSGGAVGRTLSLCELGYGAARAGKGMLTDPTRPIAAGERRTFSIEEAYVGVSGSLEFTAGKANSLSGYDGGAMVLVCWNTSAGIADFGGQGLFWEISPDSFRNTAAYAGSIIDDGGTVGTVTEAEIRAELLRGADAASLEGCH